MAEYNPSKIIKDGNTYNFRDTTKIPLAGSNEISGSLIPSTDGTVNLGSSNYQWNNAYIKSLTINGVACGDILTHNANEFVDLSSNQTISGTKMFSNGLFASKNTAGDLAILEDSSINSTNEDANGMPLTNHANSLRIKGSQASVLPLMVVAQVATSGDTSAEFRVYKYKDLNKRAGISIYYTYANDKARSYFINFDYILPGATNTTNLGSASLQWNNIYTRNILIDNDINIASSLINKTSNSGVLTMRGGISDSEGASLSLYGKDYGGSPGLIGNIYMTAYGNSDYTNFRIYPNGIIRVYNNSTATTKNVAMQEDTVPRSGGNVLAGRTYSRTVDNDYLAINGSSTAENGAFLRLHGKDYEDTAWAGTVLLRARDGSNYNDLFLKPDGTAMWAGKNLAMQEDTIPRSGGAILTGSLLASPTIDDVGFGYGWGNGGTIYTYSPTYSTAEWQGTIRLEPLKTTSNFKTMQLAPDGTWTWSGTACQITSDQRLKQQITEIDDKLLDAWEDVNLVQFKYNDAVKEKSDNARLHTGYVVQQIDDACKSHNLDISEYGLYCHEEYAEETKEVEREDGTKTIEVVRPASEHYSLRYTEALIVECAYLRKCIKELRSEIEELKSSK